MVAAITDCAHALGRQKYWVKAVVSAEGIDRETLPDGEADTWLTWAEQQSRLELGVLAARDLPWRDCSEADAQIAWAEQQSRLGLGVLAARDLPWRDCGEADTWLTWAGQQSRLEVGVRAARDRSWRDCSEADPSSRVLGPSPAPRERGRT